MCVSIDRFQDFASRIVAVSEVLTHGWLVQILQEAGPEMVGNSLVIKNQLDRATISGSEDW